MSNKRPVILMAVLLLLVGGYLLKPVWESDVHRGPTEEPLPGDNSISALQVAPDKDGIWFVDADYFFNGRQPWADCRWTLLAEAEPSRAQASGVVGAGGGPGFLLCGQLLRGKHHLHFEVLRPNAPGAVTTRGLSLVMYGGPPVGQIAEAHVARQIDWPDRVTYGTQRQTAGKSSADIIAEAVKEIDGVTCCSLEHAQQMLEGVITRDPNADAAFIELARIAMKSNWGPEGLHQANTLIQSALRIKPDNVNAKILLGYVETHQGRFKEAQATFAEAAKSDPPNLWLWANWGEMHALQGQTQQAIEKYRAALARQPTHDTYDRARLDAYQHVMPLLESRREFPAMEALYKQEAAEYGPRTCASVDHANFELLQLGDAAAAIAIARPAVTLECNGPMSARDVLGMASYMQWNADPDSTPGQAALNQARVFLPAGMRAFYLLAGSERTVPAARRLTHSNESVDALDNSKLSALAQALARHELPTARRLLGLGARTDVLVGDARMPVALIPVANNDLEGIRLMQQAGVDYNTLRFEGMTAVEQARRLGRQDLLKVLSPKSNAA